MEGNIKIHNIHKSAYHLSSIQIDDGLDYVERGQLYSRPHQMLDIYPDFWMLYLFDLPSRKLYLYNEKKHIDIAGPKALYIPPYSFMDMQFSSGWAQWQAYSCFRTPAPHFPKRPVCFSWDKKWNLQSFADISALFRKDLDFIPIGKTRTAPAIIDRTCDGIRESYKESLSIAELAKLLRLPHSTMTHAFKEVLGLSPIAYRNRIRVFDSLRQISLGNSVTNPVIHPDFRIIPDFIAISMKYWGSSHPIFHVGG